MIYSRFGRPLGHSLLRNRATPFERTVRNYYAKDEYEGKGFRKFIGPLWVLTTPAFLKVYGLTTFFYLLLYYPLDKYLLGVRQIKADMDAKEPPNSREWRRTDFQDTIKTDVTLTTVNSRKEITLPVQSNGVLGGAANIQSITLKAYSAALITLPVNFKPTCSAGSGTGQVYAVTLNLKAKLTLQFNQTVTSATKGTGDPTLALNLTAGSPTPLKVYSATANVNVTSGNSVTLTIQSIKAEGTIESSSDISSVEITIPVKIEVKKTVKAERDATSETITSVQLILPVPDQTTNNKKLDATYSTDSAPDTNTLEINVAGDAGQGSATVQSVTGRGFYPNKKGYCIYSVREATPGNKDIWANIGGKCEYVACYYKNVTSAGKTHVLLVLYFRSGGSPEKKYFGRDTTAGTVWKTIPNEDDFIDKLKKLANNNLTLPPASKVTPQYNRVYEDAILNSPTWFPLVMHGMAVGSFGSIFPNLIPKTLVCARTSRTLSVVSIFLSPVPHIINLALAENDLLSSIGVGDSWIDKSGWPNGWPFSYLLYIFYGLAFLFAIFNVHSPEWKLCCYIRSHGWMPLMMTLSITLIIEILIAIARAGIMTQKSANKKLNHPLLWNKIACLMGLSYLPFWMTTTPMMNDDTNGNYPT